MSNIVDFSVSNSQVTDEIINVPDSNPINLAHDIFYNKTGKLVVISTGAGGSGTVLTNVTDYTLGGTVPDGYFPTSISPDVGYTTVAITNATYHSTDLYVSYYPIADSFRAARYNTLLNPPSLGDFDISTANATLSMAVPNSYPVGYRFRVSWYNGDGSNNFTFTNASGLTLDGIAFSNYVGQGTGHLNLVKTATNTWQTFGVDVWDSDGGNFGDIWEKRIDGKQIGQGEFIVTTTSFTTYGGIYVQIFTSPRTYLFPSLASITSVFQTVKSNNGRGGIVAITGDTTEITQLIVWNGTNITGGNITIEFRVEGRWTTSYPRRS